MNIPRILRMLWTLRWIASSADAVAQRRGASNAILSVAYFV